MTDTPHHPLADLFAEAELFYLPDGIPAAITWATFGRRKNNPVVTFRIALDARGRPGGAALRQPILATESFIARVDGQFQLHGARHGFSGWQARPVKGRASHWNVWRSVPRTGTSLAVATALRGCAETTPDALVVPALTLLARQEPERCRKSIKSEEDDLARFRARESSAWRDELIQKTAEALARAQAGLADVTAFLAEIQPWMAAHAVAPDPDAAARAAEAAAAYTAAREAAEATRADTERRAAERAAKKAEADARLARLHGAAEELLALAHRVADHFGDTDVPLGREARALLERVGV